MIRNIFFYLLTYSISIPFYAQNENISQGNDFDGEPYIAINPYNTQHIVVAWMAFDGLDLIEMHTRVSFDAGSTWNSITQIPHEIFGNTSADPSLAFDSDGNVFLCYIDYNPYGISGQVYIRKSVDGGISWQDAVEVIDAFDDGSEMPVDRPWMVIDRSGGVNDGTIYITTKPAPWIPFPNRNYLIVSTDGGASFGDWQYIDTNDWSIGPFIQAPMATPAVSANGTFHCVYPAFDITENLFPRFIHASSTDGGENLNYHEMIESYGDDLITDTLPKLGYLLITDPTDADHLVFIFILKSFGDPDIFILESDDAGITWQEKIRVNDDATNTGVMQDMVWADFNSGGDLLVTWRDRRNAPDTGYVAASEFWGAVKWKGSTGFSPNFKLSDELVAFNDVLKGNGNDFMGCEFIGDTAFAVWGEARDETLNIWFTKLNAKTGAGTGIQDISKDEIDQLILFPNPAGDILHLQCSPGSRVEIIDAAGRIVITTTLSNPAQIDISDLPAGTYTITVTSDKIQRQVFIKY